MRNAIVIVGHGAPAKDTPRPLIQRLKALEAEHHARGGAMTDEHAELDRKVRGWTRTKENDPYQAGVEALAERLREVCREERVAVAYNEFCAPSLPEAVEELVASGSSHIVIVTTMVTPGGIHADKEIPEIVGELRVRYPEVTLRYAWPFNLDEVAMLLAAQARASWGDG